MNGLVQRRTVTVDIDGITTLQDAYSLILDTLVETAELEGAVLSNSDGLPIASILRPGLEEDYIAAAAASALTSVEKIAEEIDSDGPFEQMILKIGNNFVVISDVDDESALIILTNNKTNLGVLMAEMKKAHERLGELLAGEVVSLVAEVDPKEKNFRI